MQVCCVYTRVRVLRLEPLAAVNQMFENQMQSSRDVSDAGVLHVHEDQRPHLSCLAAVK